MRSSAIACVCILGIFIAVLFAFNYQGEKDTVPLSEIFPEEIQPVDVEYKFNGERLIEKVIVQETQADESTKDIASTVKGAILKEKLRVRKEKLALKTLPSGIYTIQVASFRRKQMAEEEIERLKVKGFDGNLLKKDLGDKGLWYRVSVGNFQQKSQAADLLTRIREHYKDSFIILIK